MLALDGVAGITFNDSSVQGVSALSGTRVPTAKMPTGAVLQAQSTSLAGAFSVSAAYGTWYDVTGLSVNITPSSVNSKILVFADVNCFAASVYSSTQIVRSGTAIYQGSGGSQTGGNSLMEVYPIYTYGPWGFRTAVYLDSPATTSTTTYKIQVANISSGTYTVYVNNRGDSYFAVPSSITVMEIAG